MWKKELTTIITHAGPTKLQIKPRSAEDNQQL